MKQDLSQLDLRLREHGYVAEPGLAACLHLMDLLKRPLLLEGDAGVGKTEVAKLLSRLHQCELLRLQCYEGLDVSHAVYEWNYQGQLLAIKLLESTDTDLTQRESRIFSERYLLKRPLLEAITREERCVLLIDEIDRADEEFEAFLLEVLSEYQVTIPELGTVAARALPWVILTSNATRELSDALRRRCLYYYIDYPSLEKELAIVRLRLPELREALARQIVSFVQALRQEHLNKTPGIAETLDWASALLGLEVDSLHGSADALYQTMSCLLKTREDQRTVTSERVAQLVRQCG